MNKNFENLYLCHPEKSPKDKLIEKLARLYCVKTEEYDRSVCTGPVERGCIMPACHSEHVLCTKNAIRVRRLIMEYAKRNHTCRLEMQRAIYRLDVSNHAINDPADRHHFALDTPHWEAFVAALDASPRQHPQDAAPASGVVGFRSLYKPCYTSQAVFRTATPHI